MLCCRGSIRLPNGNLSPAAFSPIPRSAAKAALQVPVGSALLLPSKEPQLHFHLLWEQDVAPGNFSNDYFESLLILSTAPMPMLLSRLHGLLRVLFMFFVMHADTSLSTSTLLIHQMLDFFARWLSYTATCSSSKAQPEIQQSCCTGR